jgi:hypothetical protein
MIPDANMINKVQEWRRKFADGTITLEEQKEAILILRQNRNAAGAAAAASKSKAKKPKGPAKSADDLLSELD